MDRVSDSGPDGLFDALFGRGAVGVSDQDWLQAMLDTEAALARVAERARLAAPGSGAAVTAVASASRLDLAASGGRPRLRATPFPRWSGR